MGLDEWMANSLRLFSHPSRPSVTLSYAQSLDGSISRRRGEPLALSGSESKQLTHRLRAAHDAILVGIGTVLSDDPQLNVRLIDGKSPQVIVLDSHLRTPLKARVLKGIPWIFCLPSADRRAQEKLEKVGAVIERQSDTNSERVNLPEMLKTLQDNGINTLMVEGGGEVISSFHSERLVDRVVLTIAPQFVGGYKALEHSQDGLLTLVKTDFAKFGKDLVIWGNVKP